jgi:hypothetical protein
MYEVEAPDTNAVLNLVREGEIDPIDCGTMGEPFYGESGFAVQPHDADSSVGWENAAEKLESVKERST